MDAPITDTDRIDWLIAQDMLYAWVTQYHHGNYTSIRGSGTFNVPTVETDDPRAAIDAAILASRISQAKG